MRFVPLLLVCLLILVDDVSTKIGKSKKTNQPPGCAVGREKGSDSSLRTIRSSNNEHNAPKVRPSTNNSSDTTKRVTGDPTAFPGGINPKMNPMMKDQTKPTGATGKMR